MSILYINYRQLITQHLRFIVLLIICWSSIHSWCNDFNQLQQKVDHHLKVFQFDSIPHLLQQLEHEAVKANSDSFQTESAKYHAKYYYYKSDYENAAKYMIEAAKGYEAMNDSLGASKMYNNLSQLIATTGNRKQMMLYKKAALKLCPESEESWKLTVLINLSSGFRQLNQIDSSEYYLEQAFIKSKELKDSTNIAACFMQYVVLNYTKENYKEIIKYGNEFINNFKDFGSRSQLENVLYYQAIAYQGTGQYSKALDKIKSSTDLIIESSGVINAASNYKLMAELYNKLGQNKLAFETLHKSVQYQDSIFNLDKQTAVLELEKKYETEKKEKENLELKQETIQKDLAIANKNNLLLLMSIIGILIIVLLIFLWNRRVVKEKEKRTETEQQLRRAQINPHFFFNGLNSILNQVINSEDKKLTIIYLSKFAKLMRQTLETSFNDFISIEKEMEMLDNYLLLQKMRYKDKFDYEVENNCYKDIVVPTQILQPFVENAIEHGFKNIDYRGLIKVSFSIKDNDVLKATVMDNGIGFNNNGESNKDHQSRALQIIKDRLSLFGEPQKYYHEYISNEKETIAIIYCPYK